MSKNKMRMAFALISGMAICAAYAQTSYVRPSYSFPEAPSASGPAAIQLANTPFYATAYLGLAGGYDDNLFLTPSNEKSSPLYIASPGFKVDARDANKVFQLAYQAQLGRYTSSSADNYNDQAGRAQFDVAFNPHNFLKLGFDYTRGHEPRGSTDRPIGNEPDKYRQTNPYVTYALGAPGAIGRVELYYSDPDRRYLNNRDFTAASDRTMQEYGGAFYYRAFPKTYAMVEARETNIRYDVTSPFSADERRLYAGVTWEATAATSGTVKIGSLRRNFVSSDEPTFSGTSWEGLITWLPRTYSKFDFYTARQTNESTGLGSFILTSIGGATWSHYWTSYVNTAFDVRFQRDAYQGFDRTDKIYALGLKAGYRFRRWLTLGAEFSHTKRDSNLDIYDYDRNMYLLTATASM